MLTAKAWLSELCLRFLPEKKTIKSPKHPSTLGILSFETAKTMSRILCLYKSLSESDFNAFRRSVFRSEGVRHLNSADESFLLRLACAEKIDDLDRAAAAVTVLGARCNDADLQGFGRIYADMKLGYVDLIRFAFPASEIGSQIAKMGDLILATSDLYISLEILTDMEVTDRKMIQLKSCYQDPKPLQQPNYDLFEKKLASQKRYVRRIREASLWSQSFDKTVALMARAICNVFARICSVFGPYVSDLPLVLGDSVSITSRKIYKNPFLPPIYASGPLDRTVAKDVIIGKSQFITRKHLFKTLRSDKFRKLVPVPTESGNGGEKRGKERIVDALPTTLGAVSLAIRYANVIIMAEKLVRSPEIMDEEMRVDLYQMLPWRLRMLVRKRMKQLVVGRTMRVVGRAMAKKEMEKMLVWLAPMARDMIRWRMERNFIERLQLFDSRPTVMLLQTLYFSDREKTEAAIVELLVVLSCIYQELTVGSGY